MNDAILVSWKPEADLGTVFSEEMAEKLSGLLPIRGILKDHSAEAGLMSCLVDGVKVELPVRLDEITEVRLS